MLKTTEQRLIVHSHKIVSVSSNNKRLCSRYYNVHCWS